MSANFLAAANIGAIILLLYGFAVNAAEVKVMAGGPLAAVFKELGPQFERDTGHKIVARFSGTAVIKEEIEAGEAFDLVITNASAVAGVVQRMPTTHFADHWIFETTIRRRCPRVGL